MTMGEIMQKIPMDEQGWKKDYQFSVTPVFILEWEAMLRSTASPTAGKTVGDWWHSN